MADQGFEEVQNPMINFTTLYFLMWFQTIFEQFQDFCYFNFII